ncbi:hypothetical protein R1sor_004877 [Riccia sorocarpa]|uniref:SWIM-type domain-containing protein n=1 Tax=Riccia sorocarpa TaxID=122646 RepID=A0ABD3HM92_9MARC
MVRMQIDEMAGIEKCRCVQHISEHNHHLLSAQEVRQLPAYRCISPEEKGWIRMCKEAGMTISIMMNLMRIEANKSLSFTATDVRNYLASTGDTTGHDTQELLKTLKDKHEQDPEFFYTFTVDCEGRLEHLLWIHSQARRAALYFGDVFIFDTMYKLNKYDMLFAVFTGFSNHGQTLLLGAALLRNETTPTFQWLFEEWHKTVRINPVSILTNQDRSITEAICSKLPTTKHCFCTWHIMSKFPGWFPAVLKEEFESFMRDFRRTWEVETVEEFESVWHDHDYDEREVAASEIKHDFPMEKKASERFSHYAFQKFQKELILSAEYVFQDGKVSHFQHPDIERSVTSDAERKLVQCSCRMFEKTGILCRHALRVLNIFNVLELPDSYILRRWENDLGPTSLHREYIRFQEEKEFSGSEVEKWKYMLLLKARSIAFFLTSSSCLRDKIDIEFDKLLEMVTNEVRFT